MKKDIRILAAGKEQADIVEPFIGAGAAEALRAGIPITVLAAVDDDGIMGVLSGVMDGEEFVIDSIFVDPEKRGLGAGTALIDRLDRIFPEGDVAVRAEFNIENEDYELLESFLIKTGFEEEETGYPLYYTGFVGDLISELQNKPENSDIRSFTEAGDRLLRIASNESVNEGRLLPENGLISQKLDRDSSFCIIKDGTVAGYVTVEPVDEETLKVPALFSAAEDPRETLMMLQCAVARVKKKYSPNTVVTMLAVNPMSEKIIGHLFGEVTPISRSFIKYI